MGVGDGGRTEAVDTGHRSREASRHERVREDRVSIPVACGSFARVHTSVSLYMHDVT